MSGTRQWSGPRCPFCASPTVQYRVPRIDEADGGPALVAERDAFKASLSREQDEAARLRALVGELVAALDKLLTPPVGSKMALCRHDAGVHFPASLEALDEAAALLARARGHEPRCGTEEAS